MADSKNSLPEGTHAVIDTAGTSGDSSSMGRTGVTASNRQTNSLITATDGDMAGIGVSGDDTTSIGVGTGTGTGTGTNNGGIRGMVSNVSTKAKDEAANRARGFVGDGLKSGSETLGNISTLIGDTVEQIEEKLGPQYAGYARTASDAIQRYAATLENKNPDELVDDARDLVRKSPGIALAGAAILGFAAVRLLKAGMDGATSTTRDRDTRRSRKDS